MKRYILLFSLLFSAGVLANDPIETGTFNNKAIYGYDTVAYFTQSQAIKGSEQHVTSWRGADWYFSSAEHKSLFDNNPEAYAPQYGGYCAYAMSRGRFVGIDEDAWTIYDNKLYLNYSKGVRDDWLEQREKFIRDADIQYHEKVDF